MFQSRRSRAFSFRVLTIGLTLATIGGAWLASHVTNSETLDMDTRVLTDELSVVPQPGPRAGVVGTKAGPPRDMSTTWVPSTRSVIALARLSGHASLPPPALLAWADALLARGDVDRVIERLEARFEGGTPPPALAATLTAAYARRGTASDRVRAYERARSAAVRYPNDAGLLFNDAFLGQDFLPRERGHDVWTRYLRVERATPWRAYASARQQALIPDTPADVASADAIRASLLDDLLPAWAQACVQGSAREAERRAALTFAITHAPDTGDPFFRIVARDLTPPPGAPCHARLAAAIAAFARGRTLYRRDELQAAEPVLRDVSASTALSQPLALDARLLAATAAYFGHRPADAIAAFDAVAREAKAGRYHELLARAEWMRGYVRSDKADYEGALASFYAMLDANRRAGSSDGLASAHGLISSVLDRLGQYEEGWRHRLEALRRLQHMTDSRARTTILTGAIRAASRDGFYHVAATLGRAKLDEASVRESTSRFIQTLIDLGDAHIGTGDLASAREVLAKAVAALPNVGSAGARMRLHARILMVQAATEGDPSTTAAHLGRALNLYQQSGADIMKARLLLARARAWLRARQPDVAEADLREGVAEVERVQADVHQAALRLSFLDDVWDLFDELLAIQVARNGFSEALALSERARGRLLSETRVERPRPDDAWRTLSMPPDAALAYYLVLRDRLVLWIFARGRVVPHVQSIARSELAQQVRRFTACVIEATASCEASRLSELLVAPVLQAAPGIRTLVIVPDPVLQPVPFAALRHPDTQRYLVEEVEVTFAPSLRLVESALAASAPTRQALVVGAPATKEPVPPLSQAVVEAAAIGRLYARPQIMTGAAASRDAFLQALPAADLVHFAGHALADPEEPGLSRLLLAPGADQRGNVYARDIEALRLTRAPLVVLAACETARGRTYRSEGVGSLTRAFLHAGARTVIATLWPIEDAASEALFVAFHRGLRQGLPPARALREAQRTLLASPDPQLRHPSTWASSVAWTTRLTPTGSLRAQR